MHTQHLNVLLKARNCKMKPDISKRQGAILPLLALTLVVFMGVMALAVDIGVLAIAKNQSQAVVDAAAFAGARTLNGTRTFNPITENNIHMVHKAMQEAISKTLIIDKSLDNFSVTPEFGTFSYDQSSKRFTTKIYSNNDKSAKSQDVPWTAVRAKLSTNSGKGITTSFAKFLGQSIFNINAEATAAHRPRDIAMVLDFSDSLRDQSMGGNRSGPKIMGSINPDLNIPHYGPFLAQADAMKFDDSANKRNNHTVGRTMGTSNEFIPPLINDFFEKTRDGSFRLAFNPGPSIDEYKSRFASGHYGDIWPLRPEGGEARSAKMVVQGGDNDPPVASTFKNENFEQYGYDKFTITKTVTTITKKGKKQEEKINETKQFGGFQRNFQGFTQGPGYYGKTFYIWPPDPRVKFDWRQKFFGTQGNAKLYNADGKKKPMIDPQTGNLNYNVKYDEILYWIKNVGPKVFPDNLRAGRILYYEKIPDVINNLNDMDQLFWKEYIDYVLGNSIYNNFGHFEENFIGTDSTMYGWMGVTGRGIANWGKIKITSKASSDYAGYMHYNDNPQHPRLHFWFGPLSMLTFLTDYFLGRNWLPGTAHETPTWQLKIAVKAVLDDIEANHPNDLFTLIPFSSLDAYAEPKVPLSRNFELMRNSLFYPKQVLDPVTGALKPLSSPLSEFRPYTINKNSRIKDLSDGNIPNAQGFTSVQMGLQVAYNQLSPRGGYNGRFGAKKIVIVESDGVPTRSSLATFDGTHFQNIRSDNNNQNRENNKSDAIKVINQFTSSADHSSDKNPISIHSIGFGEGKSDFLTDLQRNGKNKLSENNFESNKIISREDDTRDKVKKFKRIVNDIMNSTVLLSLVE